MQDSQLKKYKNSVILEGQEVPLQDLERIPDRRTFGEIEEDERQQWDYIYSNLKEYRFDTEPQAKHFYGQCMMHTLKRLGASLNYLKSIEGLTKQEFEEKLWLLHKIRLSRHRKSQKEEFWQAGMHIYTDNESRECVAFISTPAFMQSEIVLSVPFWLVRTNVKLPGGKGMLI
jgi:hypothetical protein